MKCEDVGEQVTQSNSNLRNTIAAEIGRWFAAPLH
jgi:hypothetical protein